MAHDRSGPQHAVSIAVQVGPADADGTDPHLHLARPGIRARHLAQPERQRSDEFRRLNPFGKVPVLEDESSVVYESTIINEYLNDEYPHPPELLPEDSAERARVRLLVDFADRAFTLPVMALEREAKAAEKAKAEREAKEKADRESKTKAEQESKVKVERA